MHRILIDTDIGVDDALAVIFALKSPELKVEAITTVSGNVHVEQCTRNLQITLECMDLLELPLISQGEAAPLTIPLVTSAHVHGSDGLGGISEHLNPDGTRLYPELGCQLSSYRGGGCNYRFGRQISRRVDFGPDWPSDQYCKGYP